MQATYLLKLTVRLSI